MEQSALLVALIMGIVEAVKRIGLENKYLPIVALVAGFGLNVGLKLVGVSASELIIGGLVASFTGMGIWSGTKAAIGK